MFSHNRLSSLYFLVLEFWLPLPVLGIAFWFGGNLLTKQIFSRPYRTVNQLQANAQPEFYLSMHVLLIQAQVDRNLGITKVTAIASDTSPNKLQFELSLTDISQVETAIAQKLGISIENIRKLVRYQIIS